MADAPPPKRLPLATPQRTVEEWIAEFRYWCQHTSPEHKADHLIEIRELWENILAYGHGVRTELSMVDQARMYHFIEYVEPRYPEDARGRLRSAQRTCHLIEAHFSLFQVIPPEIQQEIMKRLPFSSHFFRSEKALEDAYQEAGWKEFGPVVKWAGGDRVLFDHNYRFGKQGYALWLARLYDWLIPDRLETPEATISPVSSYATWSAVADAASAPGNTQDSVRHWKAFAGWFTKTIITDDTTPHPSFEEGLVIPDYDDNNEDWNVKTVLVWLVALIQQNPILERFFGFLLPPKTYPWVRETFHVDHDTHRRLHEGAAVVRGFSKTHGNTPMWRGAEAYRIVMNYFNQHQERLVAGEPLPMSFLHLHLWSPVVLDGGHGFFRAGFRVLVYPQMLPYPLDTWKWSRKDIDTLTPFVMASLTLQPNDRLLNRMIHARYAIYLQAEKFLPRIFVMDVPHPGLTRAQLMYTLFCVVRRYRPAHRIDATEWRLRVSPMLEIDDPDIVMTLGCARYLRLTIV